MNGLVSRLSRTCCCVLFLLAFCAGRAAAQAKQEEPPSPKPRGGSFDLTVSTTPIDRTASIFSAGASALSQATGRALRSVLADRVSPQAAALSRLAKLAIFDVPLTHFAAGLNHEYGHMARARDDGDVLRFTLRGGPWSSNSFDLQGDCTSLTLGAYGGGFDAEFLLERRLWDRVAEENRGGVSDAIFLLNGAAGRFYYAQQALSRVRGWAQADLQYNTGDPTRYLYQLVDDRDGYWSHNEILAAVRATRRRSWLNFADYALVGQTVNLLAYVTRGQETFAPRYLQVRGVALSPFARYHLSPVGPQTELGTHYRRQHMVGDLSVRWTEPVRGVRLLGTSVSLTRTTGAIGHPRVRLDVWRDVTNRLGARLETGFTALRWPSPRAGLQLAIGAKTDGYVLGLPGRRAVYAQAGVRVRF